jgi:hypothetical protein
MRLAKFEHHDRDEDGDDTVTERFHPTGRHGPVILRPS